MRRTLNRRGLLPALALALAWVGAPAADAKMTKGAEVEAGLVRCADVNQPTPPPGCGTDPLARGDSHISKSGDVSLAVAGALPSAAYQVAYRSLNGVTELAIGTLSTNATGSGALEKKGFFVLKDTGAGALILKRGGLDQFMSGFDLAGVEKAELEAGLVRCSEVNQSAALSTCGTDPLAAGKAEIGEDGKLEVLLGHASPNVAYEVNFRSVDGTVEHPLATFTTNAGGNGTLELDGAFDATAIGAGNLVLKRHGDSHDQFVSGFRVSEHPKPDRADETRFRVALIRCVEVNRPAALAACGIDELFKGLAGINEKGTVGVVLIGAEPQQAYNVVFRALDGTTEIPIGTLTTNRAGNVNWEQKRFFPLGDALSGNIIVKRDGFDQFVTGVKVIK